MKTLFYTALFFTGTSLLAQTVTTFSDGTPDDAIAFDTEGNIYASNFTGDTVFKFTPDGTESSFVSGLDTPNGIDFDSNGNLYLCDWNANILFRYTSDGNEDTSESIAGNPSGMIKSWDSDDMIYTTYTSNTINRITPSGDKTEISSDDRLNGPVGLAYDEAGTLYVGNYNNREVYRVLSNGDLEYVATVGASSNLGFIAYAQGRLWGTVLGEHKIYVINPNGVDEVTLYAGSSAGSTDGDLSEAKFNRPNGIKFGPDGTTMYVTDFGTKNLRIISDVSLATEDVELDALSVQLIMSPSRDTLSINGKLLEDASYELRVFDLMGKKIMDKKGSSSNSNISEVIDSSNWSNGTYVIEISSGSASVSKKIVK